MYKEKHVLFPKTFRLNCWESVTHLMNFTYQLRSATHFHEMSKNVDKDLNLSDLESSVKFEVKAADMGPFKSGEHFCWEL